MSKFSARFRIMMKERKLTFTQLGALFQKRESVVRSWADGRWRPAPEDIVKLVGIFNVSADYLLGRSNIRAMVDTKPLDLKSKELAKVLKDHYEGAWLFFDDILSTDVLADVLDVRCTTGRPVFLEGLGMLVACATFDEKNPDHMVKLKERWPLLVDMCEKLPQTLPELLSVHAQAYIGSVVPPLREAYEKKCERNNTLCQSFAHGSGSCSKFGTRLRMLIKERNLTFAQLGALFQKTEGAMRSWVEGRKRPAPEEIVKLADLFNVSADYLLGCSNVRNPSDTKLMDLSNEKLAKVLKGHYEGVRLFFDNILSTDVLADVLDVRCSTERPVFLEGLEMFVACATFDRNDPDHVVRLKERWPLLVDRREKAPHTLPGLLAVVAQGYMGSVVPPLRDAYRGKTAALGEQEEK